MDVANVTWYGPGIDDRDTLAALPQNCAALLRQYNGFIQFHGGLHVRGACLEPTWHSLRHAWSGPESFHVLYSERIRESDVPFAEDCVGDQYLVRDGSVILLHADTGEVEDLDMRLATFLGRITEDPAAFLHMQPLLDYQPTNGMLAPGQLLAPIADQGSAYRAVPALEGRLQLAQMANENRVPQ